MKILILGGSNSQINAVMKSKQKGYTVIVSDYFKDAPAKEFCDYGELTSTFDIEGNIEIACRYGIDGVITLGTDQPVYTAAMVAEQLKLPSLIDVSTAKAATNKKIMKSIFKQNGIPSVNYRILGERFLDEELKGIKFPVVIKPLDSQGQRGVYKVDSISEVRTLFDKVLSFSREKEILVEEYYESDEITLSGWVVDDRVHVLTITDRVTYNNFPHIGICIAHNFPSKHLPEHMDQFLQIAQNITNSFNIHNGPVYYQMLVGDKGVLVNEIACRIGGAYEDDFIPMLTGIDILDMLIDASMGKKVDYSLLQNYSLRHNKKTASVQMIFIRPGTIGSMENIENIRKLPGVKYAKYNFKPGFTVGKIENATQRVGYMIIEGENEDLLRENIKRAFSKLGILDQNGNDMVMIPEL